MEMNLYNRYFFRAQRTMIPREQAGKYMGLTRLSGAWSEMATLGDTEFM